MTAFAEAATVLSAEGVGKRYRIYGSERMRLLEFLSPMPLKLGRDFWAVRGVDFNVRRGEALGIVGANGSGKSSLLRVIAGITPPSEGQIQATGRVSTLLDLGGGFHQTFTGAENVRLSCAMLGMGGAEAARKFDEIVQFADLGEFLDLPVRTYSKGMLMRLGFAVATQVECDVLLVDEVLAVGDERFQRRCVERIKALRRSGVSLILVSHDLHSVCNICERVLWLEKGQVRESGPAQQVVDHYRDAMREASEGGEEVASLEGHHSGALDVRAVEFLGEDDQPREAFRHGETLKIRVRFETNEPLEDPVMGAAIFRNDGLYVFGPNTMFDGVVEAKGSFDGQCSFTLVYPNLPLLAGSYTVGIAIYDKEHIHPYEYHPQGAYWFRVEQEDGHHGLVELPHHWEFEKGD